jgi:hypothetical protein
MGKINQFNAKSPCPLHGGRGEFSHKDVQFLTFEELMSHSIEGKKSHSMSHFYSVLQNIVLITMLIGDTGDSKEVTSLMMRSFFIHVTCEVSLRPQLPQEVGLGQACSQLNMKLISNLGNTSVN